MSVSGKSSSSSILKRGTSLKSRLSESISRTPSKVRFQLPHSKKVRSILQSYLNGENSREYEGLVLMIVNSELEDSDVHALLEEATHCVSILNLDLRLFVEAILSLKWTHRSRSVITEYQSFLLNLLSAHNYHSKYAIDKLVSNFLPGFGEPEWPDGIPTDEDCNKCVNVHHIFSVLLNVVPMCRELFLQSLKSHFPYFNKTCHMHEYYLHNLLWVLDYQTQFRTDILHLIFSKLVLLDVNAPREVIEKSECNLDDDEIFAMDESIPQCEDRMKHPVAHTLDVCIDKILNYCIIECHNSETGDVVWENTKTLYQDMLTVFDKIILPTYNTHHIQFVMFNLCCYKPALVEAFLNYLWKKVCVPNVATVLRQSAVSYIASLIARGTFIPVTMLKGTLQQMAEWIHNYISTQDGLECVNSDVRVHSVFYSVCQSLFYIIAFRQRDLFNTRKNIHFLESLNLAKMVTCRLNPLRVCQPAVAQNFATVARTYQLAYCYSVMEHNSRNILPVMYQDERGSVVSCNSYLHAFFPFDPYLLKRSGQKISPFYINYQASTEDKTSESKDCDIDDFIKDQSPSAASTANTSRFTYGSSPGFKHKT